MKKLLLTAAVLLLPTMAIQAAEAETAMFNQLDTDQSGFISAEEAKAHPELAPIFSNLDVDKDEQLSLEEFIASIKK
jgi:Ca2+-binding EF-hand superfamily protein